MNESQSVALLVLVPLSLRQRVKIASAQRNCTNARVVIDALETYLSTLPEGTNAP